ncbi:MAG: sporulation protein [Candidatus Limnocylindrales bacterium]
MDAIEEARRAAARSTLVERLVERIGARAGAEAVFGVPVERGEVTIIPVARIRWGVGGGDGASQAEWASGSGGGGGVVAAPIGYGEVTGAGVTFHRIGHPLASPVMILALAMACGIVLRALGSARR